ncbi:MAG: poly-gamma-glutamate synthase PgsB [Bacteroidia bacterium]|nr:poly-gamma-glutamate synthase PgsB [Bacteroidia bacterium]
MLSLTIIIIVSVGLIVFGAIEYSNHQQQVNTIPIRIHINGTRGKSSVSRLIGAGLRAGGYKTITKVTGTFPRLITSEGLESPIHRKEKANILEQLKIIRFSARQKVDVLILECMALKPQYQKICEHQMVRATHGVITNIRLDHLDVMGPTLDDVAKALCGTIPKKAQLFTSEDRCFDYVQKIARKRKTGVHQSLGFKITDDEVKGFDYIEHKANIDLAMDVCLSLGVDRAKALAEMQKTRPDEGALTQSFIKTERKRVTFYNGFAANDPESTLMIWESITRNLNQDEQKTILLNTRKDRQDRARQLIEMVAHRMDFDVVALIGESVDLVEDLALRNGISRKKILKIGRPSSEKQFAHIVKASKSSATVLGIGNMGAGGAELAQCFEHHANKLKEAV